MKFWFIAIIGIIIIGISGCKSSREIIDVTAINKKLQFDISIQNPGEVMDLLYPYSLQHNIIIDWNELRKPKQYKATLIHTFSPTDSISHKTISMYVFYDNDVWHIKKAIQKTYYQKQTKVSEK